MKKFALLLALSMLAAAIGCETAMTDHVSQASATSAPAAAAGSQAEAPETPSAGTAPASSGGSTLQASLPYSQSNAPAASQNLNAAPFLTSAGPRSGATAQISSPGLTSRADGTMYGPGDQPAAGAGEGMIAPAESNTRPGRRPSAAAPPKSK